MQHTYTMEYYSVMRKEDNPAICDNMDRPWAHYAKWDVRQRRTSVVWCHYYVKSNKVKFIKKKGINWWSPVDGGWGIRLVLFKGTYMQEVVNKLSRSDAEYDEYRQQYHTVIV